jgi:hypothetical protein
MCLSSIAFCKLKAIEFGAPFYLVQMKMKMQMKMLVLVLLLAQRQVVISFLERGSFSNKFLFNEAVPSTLASKPRGFIFRRDGFECLSILRQENCE